MKCGPWGSKDDSKKRPKIPQERQKPVAQGEEPEDQNVAHGKKPGHHSQWPRRPVVAATVRPWWPVLPPVARFPSRLFDFRRFCFSFAFILQCIWTFRGPNSLHSNHLLHFHSFRLVLERKRERQRTARISYRASIERRECVLWMSFSSPYLIFSQSKFMFCYFVILFWICSLNLEFMQF